MKEKKDIKAKKRQVPTEGEEPTAVNTEKPKKKSKQQNGEAKAHEEKVDSAAPEKSLKTVDASIFKYFKELTNEEEQKRLDAALQLLQQVSKTNEPEKRQKELAYTLKRLVRGCGASTNTSRAGFFTSLVGLLKAFSEEELPMQRVFDVMQQELHVGATIANKEDADAVVGKILVCGALLNADRCAHANNEHLENITNVLLHATRHRSYHSSLGFNYLIELLEQLTQAQFESAVWPLLHKELAKPWPKQTLQTVHCLIVAQTRFPNVLSSKFFKSHFGGAELLNAESFEHLYKIFWQHSNTNVLLHPAFELFGTYLAKSAKLGQFWKEMVDPGLQTPTKLLEIETLKMATDILNNLNVQQTNVVVLLGDNFMKMLVEGLKTLKQKKDETLKAFYNDYLEALVDCCTKITDDAQKVAIIRRLILPPGTFNFEKYTSTRIVHQLVNTLGEQGVMELFQVYKRIFCATLPKNPENAAENWLNFERQIAGYMLQHLLTHKAMQRAYKWRGQQLRFFLTAGIFHTNDALELCKKDAAGSFSNDFGEQCKNMFYTCLQSKLLDLQQEQQLLLQLVQYCNECMQQKHLGKYLRLKSYNQALQQAWKSMYEVVSEAQTATEAAQDAKSKKKQQKKQAATASGEADKLQMVFHILLLHMGLQLYREPETAAPAIDDLLKCMQRTKQQQQLQQKKAKKAGKSSGEEQPEEEPEWIEVVVDLFLQLLSQNASALRNIVNALFPHFCGNLSLSAVHQILAMLDMKDGQNPLSTKNEDEDEDEEEENDIEEEDEDDEDEDEVEQAAKQKKQLSKKAAKTDTSEEESASEAESGVDTEDDDDDDDEDDDADDDNDEEEDDDEEEEEEEEEGTASDKLRNAISQALIGSASANAAIDDDMASVDLNDMTEEEGRKLDEALANAFKALKKTSNSPGQSKKSKSYRIKTTTVMHFRIRVLDLIEIYLQHQPTLLISIEIMLALYDMLEHCVGVELRPLQSKVEKVLNKLTAHKSYAIDAELQEDNLVDFVRLIVEKKTPAMAYDLINRMRNKCIVFLIASTGKIAASRGEEGGKVLALCQEYLQEFVGSRNPLVNITLLSDLFKLRWQGVWQLAVALTQQGVSLQTRTYRRIQIYELLSVLYKNWELQKLNEETSKKRFKSIEKALAAHISTLASAAEAKQSLKEFVTLLELLLQAQRSNARLSVANSALNTATVHEAVQQIRRRLRLESAQVYQRYCATHKLPVIRNSELPQAGDQLPNGNVDSDAESVEATPAKRKQKSAISKSVENTDSATPTQKRKQPTLDARKLKKQKKLQRLEAASRGMNGDTSPAATRDSDAE